MPGTNPVPSRAVSETPRLWEYRPARAWTILQEIHQYSSLGRAKISAASADVGEPSENARIQLVVHSKWVLERSSNETLAVRTCAQQGSVFLSDNIPWELSINARMGLESFTAMTLSSVKL